MLKIGIKTFIIIAVLLMALCAEAQVTFSGNSKDVFDEIPAKSTGLNHVYVLYSTAGVSMSYQASTDQTVTWYTYGETGGGYAEELSGVQRSGRTSTLAQVIPNKGYIIEEGTNRTYVWVVNYADYRLQLVNITPQPASDCNTVTISLEGSGKAMDYYSITGVRKVLSRELKLGFRTLTWSADDLRWNEVDTTVNEDNFQNTIVMEAPLCNTNFTLSGDRFLKYWDEDVEVTSSTWETHRVQVETTAVQADNDHDNEKGKAEEGELGGSAPVTVTFTAYPTDAVDHYEWQEASDADFNNILLRLNVLETEQTFEETGTYYWRFIASNTAGSCEEYSETYKVNIGESELTCPNFFSPGATEGSNDVWKVSYKSIVEFHCWIFNSWGNQVCELTDPSQGWDGTYHGKVVKPGVYYYVLNAKGSDGKVYKESGDINILGYHKKEGVVSNGSSGE